MHTNKPEVQKIPIKWNRRNDILMLQPTDKSLDGRVLYILRASNNEIVLIDTTKEYYWEMIFKR